MSHGWATIVVVIVSVYLSCGLVFAFPFVTRGVARVDPVAREGTWGFRLLIVPGTMALWPLLLMRWTAGRSRPPIEKNAHRTAAGKSEVR